MKKPPKIRCAIYTRKSHEEGLDQEFNSLDAQRVAAEAYVQSQMHEGWEAIVTRYDDGGFSGGTLERPALQQLLADIRQGKVDVIVVYKVDRLSRSLMDFSKLVETLDAHDVSFVSVTQAFNTTNSMGRLTLNILLSFAQFEREVTGERIRDKFAASKKKGMWMGGMIPLGYDVQHRKLLVNEPEAQQVRLIYEKYIELRSLNLVCDYLNAHGHKPKCWINEAGTQRGPDAHSVQSVRTILGNPLYIGKVRHKDQLHDGEHDAILDAELWDQVQALIAEQRVKRAAAKNQNHEILFKGKIFDPEGRAFTTTYTMRASKRYHYYLNKITKARIGISELNSIVRNALGSLQSHLQHLVIAGFSQAEVAARYPHAVDAITQQAVKRIILHEDTITVMVSKQHLSHVIEQASPSTDSKERVPIQMEVQDRGDIIEITLNISFRSYAGRKIAYSATEGAVSIQKTNHDHALITAIVRSYKWNRMIERGEIKIASDIAKKEGVERTYAGDILRLKYLAPEIVTMIMNGAQPRTLNVSQLVRQQLPLDWEAQKALLNIA